MELKTFAGMVAEGIRKEIGDEYTISVISNLKNNNIELTGIMFKKRGDRVAPTIYIEDLYHAYGREEKTLQEVVNEVRERYEKSDGVVRELNKFEADFDCNRSQIVYRLISYERNQELLKSIPYIPFLDMAITFHMIVSSNNEYMQSLRITNELQEKWGISLEELYGIAKENTEKLLPAKIRDLCDFIAFYVNIPVEELTNDKKMDMIVITNITGMHGASVMLYQGLIEQIATYYNRDLYLIPSSIHEMIIVPEVSMEPNLQQTLQDMVHEINHDFVNEEEILSDRVYRYSKSEKKFA